MAQADGTRNFPRNDRFVIATKQKIEMRLLNCQRTTNFVVQSLHIHTFAQDDWEINVSCLLFKEGREGNRRTNTKGKENGSLT